MPELLRARRDIERRVLALTLIGNTSVWASDRWAALTTYGNANYDAMWAPCLLFELIAILGLLVFSVLLAVLFFQRRRSLPIVYVAFLIAGLGENIVEQVLLSLLPIASSDHSKVLEGLTRTAVGSVIWISYFLNSKRVKSTFVVDRVKHAPAEATAAA